MDSMRILAYITGTVDQELLLRNEYLVAENRILKDQLKTCRCRNSVHAAIGSWTSPRQCVSHRKSVISAGDVLDSPATSDGVSPPSEA